MTSFSWTPIQPAQKRTAFYLSLSFLIPYLIMTSSFIVQGVHPFGSHMILTVDLYHQYAPFVAELRDKILHGKSLWLSLIHISEPTRRTPISYAVFCLKK